MHQLHQCALLWLHSNNDQFCIRTKLRALKNKDQQTRSLWNSAEKWDNLPHCKDFWQVQIFWEAQIIQLKGCSRIERKSFWRFFWKSFFIHNTHAPVNKRAKTLDKTENRQNAAQFSVVGLAELSEHTLLLNGLFSKPGGWSLGLNYCCCIRLLRIYLFKSSSFLILQHTKSFYGIKRQLASKLE